MLLVDWHKEKQRRCYYREARRHKQVADATFNKVEVVDTYSRPMPMIGPMRGDMSMAPIITAVEFGVESPSEAMNMARIRMSMFDPLKETPSRMFASAWSCDTSCPDSEK